MFPFFSRLSNTSLAEPLVQRLIRKAGNGFSLVKNRVNKVFGESLEDLTVSTTQ